ncbi:MAG: T9SS type A sorting domain-containing protein [Chitinophagaceae bacterium]|nr:T9SS type A sorting domain-containing protein [Chitinophagaceae bacterium]
MKKFLLSILLSIFFNKLYSQCVPTVGITGATDDYINNFTFGAISNLNSGDNPADYALYPMTGTFIQNNTYPFTIETGDPLWGQGLGIWIDYDGNNSFLDPGEFVWASPTSNNVAGAVLSGNIVIPPGASPGTRRMRIACWFSNLVTQSNSCGISGFGEFEDYNITIVPNTPCSGVPSAGQASVSPSNPCPLTNVTLNLTGQTNAANLTFQWLVSPTGLPGSYTPILGANTVPYTYTPSPGSTNYFRCILTCTNPGGGSDTSIASSACIVQAWSPTNNCWCIPTYLYGGTNDLITQVELGTLLNNTVAAGNPSPYWVDYTAQQVANNLPTPILYVGQASTLSVTVGSDPNQYVGVWIDYDHSGSFDALEYYSPNVNVGANGTASISITPPPAAVGGVTRMRIRGGDDNQMTSLQACGASNSGWGEAEDYLVNIIPASLHDPAVTLISGALGNCYTGNQSFVISVTNYGSNAINCATNPITCTLKVDGPLGVDYYYGTVNPAITLNPYAANSAAVLISGVNMFAGGNYLINSSLSIGNAGGVVNGNLMNDSLVSPLVRLNYRPTAGPDFNVCQGENIVFGQGLTVSGCSTPINDSVTITFSVTPTPDNVGATLTGTSQIVPGAACANQYAGNFANGILPTLPAGATFTQNAVLTLTNLSGTYYTENRFILYSGANNPIPNQNIYAPCPQGYNIGAGNLLQGGQTIGNATNFTYTRHITPAQLGGMFSALPGGSTINIGYWETYNDNQNGSDISANAGGPTVATLKIYYQYVPSSFEWYTAPSGGLSLYDLSPFNPVGVPGSGVANTNTPGTYTFYAACLGSSTCRVPVNMVIHPTPSVYQDTMSLCENPPGSNGAIFDLTTMNGAVSGNAVGVNVSYYGDQGLFYLIQDSTNYLTANSYIYSKVSNAMGCSSSDTLMLQVHPQPEFPALYVTGNVCAPGTIDIASLIDPLTTAPPGSDTLYYSDAACTIPHPNPHNISVSDTVYIVIATNTIPVCADTAIALVEVSTAGTMIANQDPLNYSIPGAVGCNNFVLTDGVTDTLYNPLDCKRIVSITDVADATSLGSTQVCEWIEPTVQTHNGQPYVNRRYQITPSVQGSAIVCLYYLQDDIDQFNGYSFINGWPMITPGVNMSISQVDNGDIVDPGHIGKEINPVDITATYDPLNTVWTVCFPVDSFSYFYAHADNVGNVPLPVEMILKGKTAGLSNELSWMTYREVNNQYFEVERSRDGKRYDVISAPIASQGEHGNSSQELLYGYMDESPFNGNNYYRIAQYDIDGHKHYSNIVSLYQGIGTRVQTYPNPVNTTFTVNISTERVGNAEVKLMDATGRVIKIISMQLQVGENRTELEMKDLASGIYMIKVSNGKDLNYTQTIRKN